VPRRQGQHIHDQHQIRDPPYPTRDVTSPCHHVHLKVVVLRDVDARRAVSDVVRWDFESGRGDRGDNDVGIREAGAE
jgi:hypothetical protein